MKVNIKYDEINNLTNYIEEKNGEIKDIINSFNQDIDDVSVAWQGKDSDAFVSAIKEYVDEANTARENYITFKDNLSSIINLYKTEEENWKNIVKKES